MPIQFNEENGRKNLGVCVSGKSLQYPGNERKP